MEAAKTSIAVTCDLYIAKIFMQIQCQGSPKDDQLFINFRPFFIKLSFFKTLGKIVGESGGHMFFKKPKYKLKVLLNIFLKKEITGNGRLFMEF